MKKNLIYCFFFSVGIGLPSLLLAQEVHCGFDLVQEELMRENASYRMEIADYQQRILPDVQQLNRTVSSVITIPVVVHVIHSGQSLGTGANLSEARILSQLEVLNQDYRRINDDADQTPADFTDLAVDTEIQFCLAKIGPEGNATNGITRHVYTDINDIDDIEDVLKPETTWDPDRYLNIWTIDMPNNSVLGYSYLPTGTMVGSVRDGVVIDHSRFGYQNADDRGRTCVHEVGHYLGLQHLWGANGGNGEPLGCDSDDGVADTPGSEGPYYGCPSFGISSCGSVDMVMNFMEYVNDDCMNLFTQGQKNVMQSNLIGIRSALAANGLTACDEVDFGCISVAQADFYMGFEESESHGGWVIENANGDNRSWLLTQQATSDWGPDNGSGLAVYLWNVNGTTAADDYLFTPCFDLQAGHVYRLSFGYAAASDNGGVYPETFEVGFSQDQSSADFMVPEDDWVFEEVNNAYPNYETVSMEFANDEARALSLGFHVFSPADRYALQIDDVLLEDLGPSTEVADVLPQEGFSLWPNPTRGVVFLTLEGSATDRYADYYRGSDDLRIKIINTSGVIIKNMRAEWDNEGVCRIDLSNVSAGVYFVQIFTNDRIWTQRIVVA